MRTSKSVVLFAAMTVTGHYGVALYGEAKAGHFDTQVPQSLVAAITVAASTSSVSAIITHVNSITDVDYIAPASERQLSLIKHSV